MAYRCRPAGKLESLALAVAALAAVIPACGSSDVAGNPGVAGCERFRLPPVLFVHGSGLGSATFSAMQREFRKKGYPDDYLLAIDLVPNDGDNIYAAMAFIEPGVESLLASAERAGAASGCLVAAPGKVALIAHSMGATSSRWYASRIAPEKVTAIVTLAGANHGTDELCGRSGSGNRQMCPAFAADGGASRLQTALNGTRSRPLDETPYGVGRDDLDYERVPPDEKRRIHFLAVALENDEWISPWDSALLAGAGGLDAASAALPAGLRELSAGNYLFTGGTRDDDLPADPAIIAFIFDVLQSLPCGVPPPAGGRP